MRAACPDERHWHRVCNKGMIERFILTTISIFFINKLHQQLQLIRLIFRHFQLKQLQESTLDNQRKTKEIQELSSRIEQLYNDATSQDKVIREKEETIRSAEITYKKILDEYRLKEQKYQEAIKKLREQEEENSKSRDQLERKLNAAYLDSNDIYINKGDISQVNSNLFQHHNSW